MTTPKKCFDSEGLIYGLAKPAAKFFYDLGYTPNMVTTIRLAINTLMFVAIIKRVPIFIPLALYIMSLYLDYVDGTMARTYNMKSTFGKYYDASVDNLILIFMGITLLRILINKKVWGLQLGGIIGIYAVMMLAFPYLIGLCQYNSILAPSFVITTMCLIYTL